MNDDLRHNLISFNGVTVDIEEEEHCLTLA